MCLIVLLTTLITALKRLFSAWQGYSPHTMVVLWSHTTKWMHHFINILIIIWYLISCHLNVVFAFYFARVCWYTHVSYLQTSYHIFTLQSIIISTDLQFDWNNANLTFPSSIFEKTTLDNVPCSTQKYLSTFI